MGCSHEESFSLPDRESIPAASSGPSGDIFRPGPPHFAVRSSGSGSHGARPGKRAVAAGRTNARSRAPLFPAGFPGAGNSGIRGDAEYFRAGDARLQGVCRAARQNDGFALLLTRHRRRRRHRVSRRRGAIKFVRRFTYTGVRCSDLSRDLHLIRRRTLGRAVRLTPPLPAIQEGLFLPAGARCRVRDAAGFRVLISLNRKASHNMRHLSVSPAGGSCA
jgi:hypothetical protein